MTLEDLRTIVERGQFNRFPTEYLTHSVLSQRNQDGYNFSMIAARLGYLKDAPKEFLTKELILDTDTHGYNCLHIAAFQRKLGTIPKKYLKKEYLSIEDKYGGSVYSIAAGCLDFDAIPPSELTEEAIFKKDDLGADMLDYAFQFSYEPTVLNQDNQDNQGKQHVFMLLKVLSDCTLNKLKIESKKSKDPKERGRYAFFLCEAQRRESIEKMKSSLKNSVTEDEFTI